MVVRFFIVQTLLSLAKLSALASANDAEDFVAQKNQQLYLTEVQITQRLQPASVKDKGNRAAACRLALRGSRGVDAI